MAIFQKSVLNKYLRTLDAKQVNAAWLQYQTYFHNPDIQQNIRELKEEQFQEGFLRELFVHILGYTINPNLGYNLETELKNVKDSKKADGAILRDGKALAVIELKGTDTIDLGKVETQAFGYKSNQPGCRYVITSNFEKLRFYIEDTTSFEEFHLFELTEADFQLLWLCLHVGQLLQDVPHRLKTESLVAEQDITKQFYKDYAAFKRELFQDLQKRNPQYDALLLFQKSQKLLDRLLFIFFGEDKGLLPPNLIKTLTEEWQRLRDMDEYRPLYEQLKKYFSYIDKGSKRGDLDIFAYNGGLFEMDDVLDSLKIDDLVLYRHTFTLSHYDFDSAVDVNILGHIFEHSLNEIEEITAQLAGTTFDQSKTKRKKDGVFYTPRYITKYIVENTIGRLCDEKKTELELHTIDFDKDYRRKDGKMSAQGKLIFNKLTEYRNYLLDLKIVDPACGSGAFLNEALDFLIKQHRQITEQEKRLFDDAIPLDIEKSILENNLYGVDINEEAVEIARLSLWLRTARPGRKLADLSHRIKIGNSLISDPAVAGDKAFDWEREFPEVFEQGGFDVVVGNPPYVPSHSISENEKNYYYKIYKTSQYQVNTSALFVEKTFHLLKPEGVYGVIIPNYWLSTKYDFNLREIVFKNNIALEVLNTYSVFDTATVDTLILIGIRELTSNFPKEIILKSVKANSINERLVKIGQNDWSFKSKMIIESTDLDFEISFSEGISLLVSKILGELFDFKFGIKPYQIGKGNPCQTEKEKNGRIFHAIEKIDESYLPLIGAGDLQRYYIDWKGEWIKYGEHLAEPRDISLFSKPRILLKRIISKVHFDATYTEDTLICNSDLITLSPKEKDREFVMFYLGIISSKLCAKYIRSKNINLNREAFPKINTQTLSTFPVPDYNKNSAIILKVEFMLLKKKELKLSTSKFLRTIQRRFDLATPSRKLEAWHTLTFKDFIAELKKHKVTLSIKDEMEWEGVFEEQRAAAQALQAAIKTTDDEIDRLVYELYGLTEEEIRIVEGV